MSTYSALVASYDGAMRGGHDVCDKTHKCAGSRQHSDQDRTLVMGQHNNAGVLASEPTADSGLYETTEASCMPGVSGLSIG